MKKFISTLLSFCLFLTLFSVTVSASPSNFSDVPDNAWYADSVQFVSQKGLMGGVGSGKFAPNDNTTRGQLVTILYRLEGEPPVSGSSPFSDVHSSDYFGKAVQWASANSIVSGVGGNRFAPNDSITREQMVTILYRYSKYKHYDTARTSDISDFRDVAKVSSYALPSMRWATAVGLISGYGNRTLQPMGKASRAELAVILKRFCDNIVGTFIPPITEPDFDLLDGYWENWIQTHSLYKFLGNGNCLEYQPTWDMSFSEGNLRYVRSIPYKLEGDTLVLYSNEASPIKLNWVRKSDNYNWDKGIERFLPDDEPFFYQTDYEYPGHPVNAMYLYRSNYKGSVPDETGDLSPGSGNTDAYHSFKNALQNHPKSTAHSYTSNGKTKYYYIDTKYTLYDIDKDGCPELIVCEDKWDYYIYRYDGTIAVRCDSDDSPFSHSSWMYENCLYGYDGNGILVHDGGFGNLHFEYVTLYTLSEDTLKTSTTILNTETCSYDDIRNYLSKCTPINNFYLRDDETGLKSLC